MFFSHWLSFHPIDYFLCCVEVFPALSIPTLCVCVCVCVCVHARMCFWCHIHKIITKTKVMKIFHCFLLSVL